MRRPPLQKLDAFASNSVMLLGLGLAAALLAALAQTIKSKGMNNLNGRLLAVGVAVSGVLGFYVEHWVRDYLLDTNAQSFRAGGRFARLLFGFCDVVSILALVGGLVFSSSDQHFPVQSGDVL